MCQLIRVGDLIKIALKQAVLNKCNSLGANICVEYEDSVNVNAKTINASITLSPDEFIQKSRNVIVCHDYIIQGLSSALVNDMLANSQVHTWNKIILSNVHTKIVDLDKSCKINMEVSYLIK